MEGNCRSIKVYGRIKPYDDSKGSELIEYDIYDRVSVDSNTDCLRSKIVFNHKPSGEVVNNKAEQQTFRFCKVFDQDTQQWEIYEVVAKPVVDSVLEGYNGTVFAYGQTGSGKTYSITGGPDKYEDRGIIPRSIQQIFEAIRLLVADIIASVFISYCEIYNETGYDLLDAAPKARKKLEDLPRVSISEDIHGNFHFRNLNLKKVETEEEALNLLFLGDSNRVTAETPMNKSSSRSHCVFTIVIATRSVSSGIVRRSKLNLVDLAGSERVSKTGVNGKTLEEAKNINLSLHFLEQVIVALNTPECKHIPYRNSMMTIVLKDSLGGNCLTTMLATLSAEQENVWETISTCRFAQRVALIKNEVFVNEELDPQMEVKILREDIKALRKQLSLVGAPCVDVALTPDEIGECQNLVQQILSKENMDSMPQIPADLRKINQCTWLLKCAVADAENARNPDVMELVVLLREREEEIASLKGATGPSSDGNLSPGAGARPPSQSTSTRTYRPRAGSALSGRSRPRGSEQLEHDRDIVSRVEANVRRFGDLRIMLENTRCVQGGDEMDEFIASVIHQIHDEERDYRMLLAMRNNQQIAEQYNPQAVEDLLVEQVEISKLKMLFDFRNLYQERLRAVDSKTGNASFDQRPAGGRSPRKYSNQAAGTGWGLPTLEETSSTLVNLPNATGEESLSTCETPGSKRKESAVSATTKQSVVTTNKTDISLGSAVVRPDETHSSRKGSAVSTATRRTSGFSTVATAVRNNTNELVSAGSEEASSSRKGSAVSTATGRPVASHTGSHDPTVPYDSKNVLGNVTINSGEIFSSRKDTVVSTDSRRTATSPRVSSRVSAMEIGYLQTEPLDDASTVSTITGRSVGPAAGTSAVSTKTIATASAVPVYIDRTEIDTSRSLSPSMADHSKVSAATRQSLDPTMVEHSKVSFATRRSLSPSMADHSKISATTRQSLDPTMADHSKVSVATRQSLDPSMADYYKVSATTRQSLDPTVADHSKVSVATRRSLSPSMADYSKVSVATRQSLDPSMADHSKVSAATRQSLDPTMADHSKVSVATRRSLSPSMADYSKVSAATRQSLDPTMADHSKVSVATRRSLSPSMADYSKVSVATRQSLDPSMADYSKVSVATRQSPDPSMADHSKVSATTRQSLDPTMADHSKVSVATRRSLDPSMADHSKVSAATRQSLDPTMADHSKVSVATRRSLSPSMADYSKVSVATRQSLDPSMADHSKVSAATRQALDPTMADHSKVSATTRRSLSPSMADHSKISATTRQSLDPSMADYYKVSAATRQSLDPSMADYFKVSAATRQSLDPSMADHSKVSATTRQSLDPTIADHSKVSVATRQSLDPSMADHSKISATTRQSLDPTMADHSKVSVATRQSLDPTMADHSKVSVATRQSLDPTMADHSKVSVATRQSLDPSMADYYKVSAATRQSLDPSMADHSKVSATTRQSLDPTIADHSKVSVATRQSLDPSMADHSKISATTRQSLDPTMVDHSKVSAATRQSLDPSMADHSKVSVATRRSLSPSMADHSKISATTRQSLDPTMVDDSKVSVATRRSLSPSMADHSKVSATTRQSLDPTMADHSKVSVATRQSLDPSMADHSKVSATTRQSLDPSMADHSKVSAATRQSLDPSMADHSKVSATTRRSLDPSMADHSKVSATTRQSLDPSMADHSKVSATTRQSLDPSMADHSKVSATTRQSPDPLMATNSHVSTTNFDYSAANSNVSPTYSSVSAAVESKRQTTHSSSMASNSMSPTNCSLIMDYMAPTVETRSLPNSDYFNVAVKGTGSFVLTSHRTEVTPCPVDSLVTSCQSPPLESRRVSANEPNANVDWRHATQLGYIAPGSNTTPVASTATRNTVSPETDQRGNSYSGRAAIPLESLHFLDGAPSSAHSAANSIVSRKVASPLQATRLSANANETVISKGQLSLRPDDGRSIAKVSAVSAVGQQLSQAQRSVSAKLNAMPAEARMDGANVNPSVHALGVSSTANKGFISPREARRLSIKRNSTSQEIEMGTVSAHSQAAVLSPAMNQRPASPKSVPQQVTSFQPPIAGNSLHTIYKDVDGVQPSVNVFQPRDDMHQCEEDKKCLSLAATQAEFDEFYGLERTDSYTCTIFIPSTSHNAENSLACCDVIPCTTSEFVATTLPAMGETQSNLSELSSLEGGLQSDIPPAIGVNLEESDKSESMIYLAECLTGDPEIDEEIIAFYKSRNLAGSRDL